MLNNFLSGPQRTVDDSDNLVEEISELVSLIDGGCLPVD